jgi:hypothetical protein
MSTPDFVQNCDPEACANLQSWMFDSFILVTIPSGSVSDGETIEDLRERDERLNLTIERLRDQGKDLLDQSVASSTSTSNMNETCGLVKRQDTWKTPGQCRDTCYGTLKSLEDDVSPLENYATGDAIQYMVSTKGKVLHGRNRGLGWRSRQVGGYLSDALIA